MSAETIHRLRLFHSFTVQEMAEAFRLDVRTIYRWEHYGVRPELIKLDPNAHPDSGPEWRRKLLFFMLERLERAGVTDNRKKEGEAS